METVIFHVCRKKEWEVAKVKGFYSGTAEGNNDKFIHFSESKEVAPFFIHNKALNNIGIQIGQDPNEEIDQLLRFCQSNFC